MSQKRVCLYQKMKKKYKFGDKVNADGENGVITSVNKIKNDSDDKYLDYIYNIYFKDNTCIELGYDDLESGWKK